MAGPFGRFPTGGTVEGVARWTVEADAALHAKVAALGGQLGRPVGAVSRVAGPIFTLPLEAGQLYWHPAVGAHAGHGPVRDHYPQRGGAIGFLGAPTADVTATPDGGR